jgi:endonuclease YncB( thermonuclease family)
MARRRTRNRRTRSRLGPLSLLVLLAAFSLFQYLETGNTELPGELRTAAETVLAEALPASPASAPEPAAGPASTSSAPASTSSAPASAGSAPASTSPVPANTSRPTRAPDSALRGIATRITDGDTFTLNYSSLEDERVRLHGIDAPERDQPYGPAAGRELARLIEGREVRAEIVERDNYGRLVARIWIDDLDINLAMVEGGHAWWYEYYAQDRRDLELAEDTARRAQRGLWAQRNPVPPWEWRRNQR